MTPKAVLMQRALLLTLGLLVGGSAHAQAPPDPTIVFDGSLGDPGAPPTQPLPGGGVDYRIEHTRGQMRGGNLFHSFGRFDIDAGDAASFLGPDSIQNILARVTGNDVSSIDGLLRSEIPAANLYLLNPAGVIFGPSARLDVKGSFHASTADSVRFTGGEVFGAQRGRDGGRRTQCGHQHELEWPWRCRRNSDRGRKSEAWGRCVDRGPQQGER